ncbi:RNA-directed DNA polymerase from mobile element jockey, partial [Varanus komodoensis]
MATGYRPVANIPFLGKVLERVVAGQLQALLDETDYLDPFQSGFRPWYGTESTLVALYDDLCREKDRGSASLLVLLDLSVAFDTIDHGEAVAVLNRCLAEVMGWMRANKLKLNPDKMEVLLVGGSGFGVGDFDLVLNGVALPLKDRVHSLGVLLDPELSLEVQVTVVARSAFLQLQLIHQLRPYLENDCLETRSFGRSVGDTDLGVCHSSGELSVPQFFMNATSVQEGDWVVLRCMPDEDISMTNFFFCKNGKPLSTPEGTVHNGAYTVLLQIEQLGTGEYSCGFQWMDSHGQKKFAVSAAEHLTVLQGETAEMLTSCVLPEIPKMFSSKFTSTEESSAIVEGMTVYGLPDSLRTTELDIHKGVIKDGHPFSSHKPQPDKVAYSLSLRTLYDSAGQYSCGYQIQYRNNQTRKSSISASRNLTILSGQIWAVGVVILAILILAPLIYLLVKKVASPQRSLRVDVSLENMNNLNFESHVE